MQRNFVAGPGIPRKISNNIYTDSLFFLYLYPVGYIEYFQPL